MKVFPTCLFAPNGVEADIERRVVSGGTSLSGDDTLIGTDGGGRVFAEFNDFYLDEPEVALAYRALSVSAEDGLTAMIVPLCDARHQPTAGRQGVRHSDKTRFADESLYRQEDGYAMAALSAPVRAVSLRIKDVSLARPLLGGEWFSIDHPVMRHRAYRVGTVDEEAITFRPPLREAVAAGTALNFGDPLCTMRLDGPMRSPSTIGFAEAPTIRFVEHFPGPQGYANG